MSTHSFDLAMSTRMASWYKYLPSVESALEVEDKIFKARTEAGWALDDSGWYAPNGQHETEWEGEFPEEKLFDV